MEIIIGAFQFGIEFNKTSKREEIVRLQTKMEEFFAKKNYSPMVEQLQIKLFCLPFCFLPYKRPMYYEDLALKSRGEVIEHVYKFLSADITIENADEYLNSDEVEGYRIVEKAIIDYFQNKPLPVKIRKSFDTDTFLDDIKVFFDSYITSLTTEGLTQ